MHRFGLPRRYLLWLDWVPSIGQQLADARLVNLCWIPLDGGVLDAALDVENAWLLPQRSGEWLELLDGRQRRDEHEVFRGPGHRCRRRRGWLDDRRGEGVHVRDVLDLLT